MDTYHLLVIILSVLLAVLLLIGIIIGLYAMKLVRTIKQLTDRAASVVESASEIRKFVSPAATGRIIFEAVQRMIKSSDKKRKD